MDHDEIKEALEQQTRQSGRDYWYWKDKGEMEWGAVRDILSAAGLTVGVARQQNRRSAGLRGSNRRPTLRYRGNRVSSSKSLEAYET